MMQFAVRIALALLFVSLSIDLPARGKEEEKNDTGQSTVRVSGRVRLVGNEPFTELVITGPDGEWYIKPDEGHKFRELQQRTVTVEGIETVVTLRFASGNPAGERRTLSDIQIITVE